VQLADGPGHPNTGIGAYWLYEAGGWTEIYLPWSDPREAVSIQLIP
jgi:hypothetical protein